MSFLEYRLKFAPTGFAKVFYVNWSLYLLICACATIGWLMLYSISGGDMQQWAEPQMKRFGVGMVLSLAICFTPIWFWRSMSAAAYIATFALLLVVYFFGAVGMGAQRWIDFGFVRLQPSEFMKVSLIMMLATYYDWLDDRKVSRLPWVILPVAMILAPAVLVLMEPNLGTTLMLVVAGASVMFAAGVSLWYFGIVIGLIGAGVAGVFLLRGTPWQFLHDYQYRRIDTFLDPSADPLGAGYNILKPRSLWAQAAWRARALCKAPKAA